MTEEDLGAGVLDRRRHRLQTNRIERRVHVQDDVIAPGSGEVLGRRGGRRGLERFEQVHRDLDLLRIATDLLAPLQQHFALRRQLGTGTTGEVPVVCVLGDDPQRALLATSADHQGWPRLLLPETGSSSEQVTKSLTKFATGDLSIKPCKILAFSLQF